MTRKENFGRVLPLFFVIGVVTIIVVFSIVSWFLRDNVNYFNQKKIIPVDGEIIYSNPNLLFYNNTTDNYQLYKLIENKGAVKILTDVTLQVALDIREGRNSKDEASVIAFQNQYEYGSPQFRRLGIQFYEPNNNWVIAFHYGQETFYQFLRMGDKDKDIQSTRFILRITDNGKRVVVENPFGDNEEVKLPDSLYATSNDMEFELVVAPKSSMAVSGLILTK